MSHDFGPKKNSRPTIVKLPGEATHANGARVNPELEILVKAARELEHEYQEVLGHAEQLRAILNSERTRFQKLATHLYLEVEHLKKVHPLRGLLAAKQAELERLKVGMKRIPAGNERTRVEAMIKDHIRERDEIWRLLEKAEQEIANQLTRIEDALQAKQMAKAIDTQG